MNQHAVISSDCTCFQSMDPVPMHGRDLGVHLDDLEVVEAQQEIKKEVLENKDVSSRHCLNINIHSRCERPDRVKPSP